MAKKKRKKKSAIIRPKDFDKMPVVEISKNVDKPENLVLEMNETPKLKKEFYDQIKNKKLILTSNNFKPYYKEARVYKPKPVYESFEKFPSDLFPVFELAIHALEPNIKWVVLKNFLINKTHPRKRWLWGFSLRHRGTEKIRINNNDLLVLMEWNARTGGIAFIEEDKLYNEDTGYLNLLSSFVARSKVYSKVKDVQWLKELYLKELENFKNENIN